MIPISCIPEILTASAKLHMTEAVSGIERVRLYTPGTPSEPGTLYCCADGIEPMPDCCVVAPVDRLPEVLNTLLEFSGRFQRWESTADAEIGMNCSLQRLCELFYELSGASVLIADPSLKCLARCIPENCEDVLFREMLQQGYPSRRTYDAMNQRDYYSPVYYKGGVHCLETCFSDGKKVLLKGIRVNKILEATILMLLPEDRSADFIRGIFTVCTEKAQRWFDSQTPQRQTPRSRFQRIIAEVLSGTIRTEAEIQARFRYAGVPALDDYNVILADFRKNRPARVGYALQSLQSAFPGIYAITHNGRLLILYPVGEAEEMVSDSGTDLLRWLKDFLPENSGCCGISGRFMDICLLPQAVQQAEYALEHAGDRMYLDLLNEENSRQTISWFGTYLAGRMIESLKGQMPAETLLHPALRILWEKDRADGTDNLRVLYIFLCCSRNYTDAAKLLFMHRNSVIYRINRIRELTGISEITSELAQQLLFSYHVLEYLQEEEQVQ